MSNLKFRFDTWKTYVERIGEMILDERYSISNIFKKDELNYNKFKKNYEYNFIKYKTEERFLIPIIGMISSGKSTFLNSILRGNYLSISTNVETSFICILRHNKYLNQVPKLYKCKIIHKRINYEYNDFNYYHFEKKEEIEGDILSNIRKINEDLRQYENEVSINKRDINRYFYIMELNMQLFENNNELGNYFDFLDIPGLNGKDNFFLEKIIPILVEKSLFSIYIFDIEHFQDENNLKIFKKYNLMRAHKNNSLFILNKIDIIYDEKSKNKFKDEKYYTDIFLNILTKKNNNKDDKKEEGFEVDLKKNIFLKLSSLELYNEINLFSDFKIYISYLTNKNKGKEKDDLFNFTEAIKENIIKDFQISEAELENILNDKKIEKYSKYFDENEYEEISNIISNGCFQSDLEEDDYQKFKYIFKTKKKNNSSINNLKIINEKLIDCMNKSLDEFFDWNKVLYLIKIFQESIERIFWNNEEGKKYINLVNGLIKDFKKELEEKNALESSKWDIKLVEQLKKIIDSLIKLDENNPSLIQLKRNYDLLTYFVYNYRKIRISLLGGCSTGKSSFLNCLIGKDILPCDLNRCTNRGIIIRHNEKEISQLFKTKFIRVENPEYYYFQEDKKPICEGNEEIKKKLIELNKEKVDFENSFVVLKIPLKMFSELDINLSLKKSLMEKIELIDYPGLDIKDEIYEKEIFSPLMKFSDGFIFVNDCDLIEEKRNLDILEKIMNEIQNWKFSFSYKFCLFLLNKLDKSSKSLNIEKSKKLFEKFFIINNEQNKGDLNVNKFSSKLYSHYLQFYNKYIKSFELYITYIMDNLVESQEKEKLKNYKEFLNLILSKTKRLMNQINKKFAIINNDINEDLNSINDCLYKIFSKLNIEININLEENGIKNDVTLKLGKEIFLNYLYLYNNYKFQNQRVMSNANSLFESLLKLFENSYYYAKEQFSKYFNLFIERFNNLFVTIDLKLFGNLFKEQYNFNENEKKNLDCGSKALKLYYETIKYIKIEKLQIINKIDIILNSFYHKYCENSDINNMEELNKLKNIIKDSINNYLKKIRKNKHELNLIEDILNNINLRTKKDDTNSIYIYDEDDNVYLNTNFKKYDEFKYEDNLIENIGKLIGNIFIGVFNWLNEKDILQKNFENCKEEIGKKLYKYEKAFMQNFSKKTDKILNIIYENLINITGNFDSILNKRELYEKIKEEFYEIIYGKK